MFKRIISLALSVVFSLQTCGFAQVAQLNLTGYLGRAGSASALDRFRPASLRYFSYEPKTDDFRILLDKADEKGLSDIQVKDKADELMKYFRIGLSLPNDKFWVNLRPDAPEQIIDDELAMTDIGKIMLEADLQLKKDTASWTSPQTKEGKAYWDKLYQKAGELFGTENITIPTITRPWIVPGEIIVRESGDSAYIYKAALKVMLEEDYLTSRGGSRTAPTYQQYAFSDPRLKELNQYSTQLIRELIIPKLTKEINRAKRYAGLRQVFYSLVLSRWFKDKFNQPQSGNELTKLIDSGNLSNLSSKEAWDKTTYFKAYQKSFTEGEYNLSESVYTPTGQVIRRYMSGGTLFGNQIRIGQYSNIVDSLIAPKGAYVITGNGLTDQTAISAGSAIEEKEILNAKKAKLEGIIKMVFERSKKIEGLQKAVWIGRSEAAGGLSEVKKVCDEIIKWIDNNEPEIDKEPLRVFSDSLRVIAIIEELKSLALLLQVSPSIINKALEKIETVQDETQRREILKELVNQLEAIMPAAEERLRKISAYLNKSGSPLSEKIKNLLTELGQKIKELSDNFDSLPKSNQDLPILAAQLGKIQMVIEKMRDEVWYFLSPEVLLADRLIESGIDFELIHDAFNGKLQEALKKGQKFSDSHQFILEKKISIAGVTYNSFDVSKVTSPSLDGYKISFRYSDGNRDDITLYVDRDIEKTSVTVGNEAIKEELIRQIEKGSNLQYIVEPIKKALVSSAVTAAQTPKAGSALTLRDELKSALLIKQKELAALGKIAYSPRVINPISQLITEAISALETEGKEELNIGNIEKLIKDISAKIKKDLLRGTMDDKDKLGIIEKLNSLIEDSHIITRIFEQEKPALTKIGGFIMENIKIIPKGNLALTPKIEISDKITFKEINFQHPYFTGDEVKDNVSISFYEWENQDMPSLRLTLFTDGDIDVYGSTEIMDFIYGSTLSEAYGKGDVRNFLTIMINRLEQQLARIIIDGMRNNDYSESDWAKLIKGIGEILGVEVTGMIDLVIAELSDEKVINKLKSLKKSLSAGAVSPGESLNLKALRMLSEYLDDEMYQQVSPHITNARGIGELKEKFDNIVEALKNKAKWAGAKAFNPGELNKFSDTLSVLVIVEKMDKILEEKHRHIKMTAQTYASLSKEQQFNDLAVVLQDLKEAGEEIKSLSLQLEESWAKIASSSLLTKSGVIKIINDFIELLKNQFIPNENFLKRIELTNSNEEIRMLLERLIHNNDSFMDAWEELQKNISEPLEINHLSQTQFYDQLKNMFENDILGKVLVIGAKNGSYLTATVKALEEYSQPSASKASFNLEWIDNTTGRAELIKTADMILTNWEIAGNIVKHFEFNVILSDGNMMILKKIPSSIPGQEARGENSSLIAVEAVKLAKEAIWGTSQITIPMHPGKPPIDAVKSMFKSILRDKNYTSEPVSYLSDFKKIVEQCSGEVYGSNFASLFYCIKQVLNTSQIFDAKDELDLRRLQGLINGAFEGYLKFIRINIPEFMSDPNLIMSKDLNWVIEFINKNNEMAIKLPNKTKIGKSEVLACLEFIKEVTASSAITNEELKKKSEEMESLRKQLSEAIKVQQEEIKQDMEIWLKERIDAVESQLRRDLLFQAQRGISDLMISITEHREVLQKLIKQAIDSSEKSQSIDMIAEYINTFQKSGERMVEAREKIYSKFPYDSSLTSDDKEKILDIIGKIKAESREYYKKLREVYASSALTALPLGGIDFRQMNMLIQPMGSFAGLDFSPVRLSSSALEAMDLDKELVGITRMASGSMLPSPQRLKEYISACIFKGKVGEKGDEFVLSMLEVFQLQAEEGIESSAEEREAVVMADTRRYVFEGAP